MARKTAAEPELTEDDPQVTHTPRAISLWRGQAMRRLRWFSLRAMLAVLGLVLLFSMINPPTTWTILSESRSRDITPRQWVGMDRIAPVMARSVVAAEDANFCLHWGFDMTEIRKVIAQGSSRGASTISQQTVKNVYLWQGRSWVRKALETGLTPLVEALWSKRRILEVYLNVAEFGPGIFGVEAAAQHYFGVPAEKLTAAQAARLAAVLPDPKRRVPQAGNRSRAIFDGAATIAADGRARCFQ